MNKRREIKRLAEKAVGEMIELLYKHMNPVGSLCVQISTNELPPDQIPILHITNSEVVIDGTIHASPVRYIVSPEYFGKKIRNRMVAALRRKQLEADAEESSAQKFINILRERGVDKSIVFLEETGFSPDGIKRVLTAVLDKIQKHENAIHGNLRAPIEEPVEETVPMPPPRPMPSTDEPRFTRSEEILIRNSIGHNQVSRVVDQFDRIINEDVSETATRRDNSPDIPSQYTNDQQVQACRLIRSYFDDVSTTNFIGFEDKIEITTRARGEGISVDVIRSMIAMFNNIRQIGQRHNTLNVNHRAQAKALVHYLFGNDIIISINSSERIALCGQLLGVYEPYVIEEIANHNAKANRIIDARNAVNSEEEVDSVNEEDLQAAADRYDQLIRESNQESLFNQMEENRQRDERGTNPWTGEGPAIASPPDEEDILIPTASQLEETVIVDDEMEFREHTEFRLTQVDPNRNYVQIIEEYYTDFIHNIGWISDPDRSYLSLELCNPSRTSRTPEIMHEVINVLNSREHLPAVENATDLSTVSNEDLRVAIDQFNGLNSQLTHLDPTGNCRVAIQDYFSTFLYSIGWISSEDRSELINRICDERDINPDLMNHIITFLNSRENLPVGRSVPTRSIFNRTDEEPSMPARVITDEQEEEQLPEGFIPEELLDIRQDARRLIINYLRAENLDVDYIDNAHRVELLDLGEFEEIPRDVMSQAIHEFNGNIDNPIQRIDIDDAALRLFAHITGTTNHDVDTMGTYVPQDMITQLYESADRNNIPRDNMGWAILTYNQIHENESMNGYDEEQGRQSDVFINANYSDNEIINDADRLVMIDRARLLGIDTAIFELSIDTHNRVLQENTNPQTTEGSTQD